MSNQTKEVLFRKEPSKEVYAVFPYDIAYDRYVTRHDGRKSSPICYETMLSKSKNASYEQFKNLKKIIEQDLKIELTVIQKRDYEKYTDVFFKNKITFKQ